MTITPPDTASIQDVLELDHEPEFVATGGFKAVYKMAVGESYEALKAIQIPSAPEDNDDALLERDQLIARAKREVTALRECKDPGIVKLGAMTADMHKIEGQDYLVYSEEFLEGSSLAEWLKKSFLTPTYADLFEVFVTLTALIADLSSRGYLHRDFKPDNIMETGDPSRRFVALDMGIAYKVDGTQLTQGGPPGTLRYMAPELLKPDYKDHMDFRCDLYSAALTVYVLASKTHPFAPKPEAAHATAYRIITTQPIPLSSLRPDLPVKFCSIIDRCLKKRPALRFSNLSHLQSELQAIRP